LINISCFIIITCGITVIIVDVTLLRATAQIDAPYLGVLVAVLVKIEIRMMVADLLTQLINGGMSMQSEKVLYGHSS